MGIEILFLGCLTFPAATCCGGGGSSSSSNSSSSSGRVSSKITIGFSFIKGSTTQYTIINPAENKHI